MKPIYVEGMNVAIAENQEEYLTLPAYRNSSKEGEVTSCWEMNWKERIKFLFTGRIYLTILTFDNALQPQIVTVEKPF